MLDPTGDDEQLPWLQFDVPITQMDCEVTLDDEEEVIGVVVLVPDIRTYDLRDLSPLARSLSYRDPEAGGLVELLTGERAVPRAKSFGSCRFSP